MLGQVHDDTDDEAAAQKAIPGFAKGYEDSARTVHQNLKKFLHTLRAHIQMEDAVFFLWLSRSCQMMKNANWMRSFGERKKKWITGFWNSTGLRLQRWPGSLQKYPKPRVKFVLLMSDVGEEKAFPKPAYARSIPRSCVKTEFRIGLRTK